MHTIDTKSNIMKVYETVSVVKSCFHANFIDFVFWCLVVIRSCSIRAFNKLIFALVVIQEVSLDSEATKSTKFDIIDIMWYL